MLASLQSLGLSGGSSILNQDTWRNTQTHLAKHARRQPAQQHMVRFKQHQMRIITTEFTFLRHSLKSSALLTPDGLPVMSDFDDPLQTNENKFDDAALRGLG